MTSLGAHLAGAEPGTLLLAPGVALAAADLVAAAPAPALVGATVALRVAQPADLVRCLVALDGRAAALLLLAPALPEAATRELMAATGASVLVSDGGDIAGALSPAAVLAAGDAPRNAATAWIMTTSGTTGLPKTVRHSLATLARAVRPARADFAPVWGLLYEPSRFAGLQVVLQALLGGGRLAIPDPDAAIGDRLRFLAAAGTTHLSATPSLWRKLLMAPELGDLALRQVTLGGEIADDRLLATLAARLPTARIVHIYASTEVGVGFSVADRRAGFPAAWLESGRDGVGLKVADDILWARPPGTRATAAHLEVDAEGYVRTGDRVRREGDRVLFLGRDSATVNIGGTKVQPEEVEAVIARHPQVAAAHVVARPNPILGAVLALSVVPAADADPATLVATLKAWLKTELPREAQPATIKIVDSLAVNAAGKVAR